jgi:hypothetical protein
MRCLTSGTETTIDLEASKSRYFSDNVELGSLLQSGCLDYLVPRNINYPAIDAISVNPRLFLQMTVSPSHGVNVAGLDAVVSVLDNSIGQQDALYDLVFVVPSDMYRGYGAQKYEFPKGKAYGDFASTLDRVSQKVLKLPAPAPRKNPDPPIGFSAVNIRNKFRIGTKPSSARASCETGLRIVRMYQHVMKQL